MTYFGFLLRFLFIPILIFLAITYWDERRGRQAPGFLNSRAVWTAIFAHVLVAVIYTTPWDNYLVATGVWYYNPDLVTGIVIGYVPIEEYTFFVVETILSGLWWWFLARRLSPPKTEFKPNRQIVRVSTAVLVSVWAIFTYLFFFGDVKWTYLGITLFWALPAILPRGRYDLSFALMAERSAAGEYRLGHPAGGPDLAGFWDAAHDRYAVQAFEARGAGAAPNHQDRTAYGVEPSRRQKGPQGGGNEGVDHQLATGIGGGEGLSQQVAVDVGIGFVGVPGAEDVHVADPL